MDKINPDILETLASNKEEKRMQKFLDDFDKATEELRDVLISCLDECPRQRDVVIASLSDVLAHYMLKANLDPRKAQLLLVLSLHKEHARANPS